MSPIMPCIKQKSTPKNQRAYVLVIPYITLAITINKKTKKKRKKERKKEDKREFYD